MKDLFEQGATLRRTANPYFRLMHWMLLARAGLHLFSPIRRMSGRSTERGLASYLERSSARSARGEEAIPAGDGARPVESDDPKVVSGSWPKSRYSFRNFVIQGTRHKFFIRF